MYPNGNLLPPPRLRLCQGGDEQAGAGPEQDLHGPSGGGGAGAELSQVEGPKSCNATGDAADSQQEPAATDKDEGATVWGTKSLFVNCV